MAVTYDKDKSIFKLDTARTSYLIGVTAEGYVGHIYYGLRLAVADGYYLMRAGRDASAPALIPAEKSACLDTFPMEYPTGGMGDFRESCLDVRSESGNLGCELFYKSHMIADGKPGLPGLPASFGTAEQVQTLTLTCADAVLGLRVALAYSVFEKEDIITRSVQISNEGTQQLRLEKVYSACLDLDNEDYELLTLHGAWARERHIQRRPLQYGRQSVGSVRGESGHQQQPFAALVSAGCTQERGEVYAMHFVYSGNFLAQAERSQYDSVRLTMGISPYEFSWNLAPGEAFTAPEVVMTYSAEGLGGMTRSLHDFYRNHMIRSPYGQALRPVLVNNWEATYFDFDTDKLLELAHSAKDCGIEMLVMDDGWFGHRNDDRSSLGDWTVNEDKLPGGLERLVRKVNEIGLQFGLWMEPEMVSRDSDLYRAHPDWAIHIPGRVPGMTRSQYVLDLSNPQVVDYVYASVARVLHSAPIAYLKWDMNRPLYDLGSAYLDAGHQQELGHRYVLGLYALQERLVTEFPNLLLENCSAGGARFDPGMLYYSPQIWCSDDTDAVERLAIQEGTALLYPLSAIGAHVSDCPNHEVGRNTPFTTRGHVALAGTFGYELDITKLSDEERGLIRQQVADYHKYEMLVRTGDYYRIASYADNHSHDCYMVVSKDRTQALVTYVQVLAAAAQLPRRIRLQGLDPATIYHLEGTDERYTGEILMHGGFLVDGLAGDAASRLYYFVRE